MKSELVHIKRYMVCMVQNITQWRKGTCHASDTRTNVKIKFSKKEFYVSRYDLVIKFGVKGVSNCTFQEWVIKYSL